MRSTFGLVLMILSSLSFAQVNDPLCTNPSKQDEIRKFVSSRAQRASHKIEEKKDLLEKLRPLMKRAQAQEAVAATLAAVDIALVGLISGTLAGAGVGAGGLGIGAEGLVLMGWSGIGTLSVKLYTDGTQKDSYAKQTNADKPLSFEKDLKEIFVGFDKLQEKYVDMKINEEQKIENNASKSFIPSGFFAYDALASKVSHEEAQLELYKAEFEFASEFDKNLNDYCAGRFTAIKLQVQSELQCL